MAGQPPQISDPDQCLELCDQLSDVACSQVTNRQAMVLVNNVHSVHTSMHLQTMHLQPGMQFNSEIPDVDRSHN
jgi:hypothetical protein